ncbi:hypothetical protein BKA62DRAFT_715138 [Auriculariales sp. MPI-PUGE-AT-0066]|nr:hypothetical protein BKA62DRAFT_715138 [Auriculariales sp. MPI-PUGE-AT-0066]
MPPKRWWKRPLLTILMLASFAVRVPSSSSTSESVQNWSSWLLSSLLEHVTALTAVSFGLRARQRPASVFRRPFTRSFPLSVAWPTFLRN